MDEKTCMSEELFEDLTFEQVNSLMSDKLVENEINGEKLMQMDIDKFAVTLTKFLPKLTIRECLDWLQISLQLKNEKSKK